LGLSGCLRVNRRDSGQKSEQKREAGSHELASRKTGPV
jgi:hypothetical protein